MHLTWIQRYTKLCLALCGIFAVFLFLIPSLLNAQSFNQEINYQGKLLDDVGAPVADGSYSMVFRLYTVSSGGTHIWTETQSVTVQNGLFSVMLGDVSSLASVNFNQTLYLGINVEADGEMSPRKVLGAVPAAFEAKNAQTLGGIATTSFLRSDQADTLAATAATTLLTIQQSGAGNILDLFDGGTNVFTVRDGGNVGIGTTSPARTLVVDGDFELTGGIFDNNGTRGSNGYVLQTTGDGIEWVATSSLGFASAASVHDPVTLAGTPNYITLSGQQLTLTQLDLADDVATFASSVLAGRLSDETGTGRAVFSVSPAFSGTATFSSLTATTTITSPVFASNGADIADTGIVRLANAELIAWEASPAGTDVSISVNASEQLVLTGGGAFIPSANDGASLGVSGTAFADLFLAAGGVVNFDAGDVSITDGTDTLLFTGAGASGYSFDNGITLGSTVAGAATTVTRHLALFGTTYGFSVTSNTLNLVSNSVFDFYANSNLELRLNATNLQPGTNDGLALGVSGTAFSDLFLAAGGVVNIGAGDTTITGGTNVLTFAGATTNGYQFQDGPIRPVANDGVSLGISGTAFSDLFLASGAVVNFNAGDVTLTHSADTLTVAGGALVAATTTISNSTTFTANGTIALGDGGDTIAINSSSWDVSTAGIFTGGTWQGTAITDTYIADTLTIGAGSTIADDLIVEADLAIANSPSDELCLTYEGTGTTLEWQSCASGSLTTADIDTSAELAAILTDETGTGRAVFSVSPAFSGTATFSSLTATSTVTLSALTAGAPLSLNASNQLVSTTSISNAYVADTLTVSGGTLGSNTISAGATFTTAGTLTIGDGGDRIDVSSNTWDVTNGVITNVTSVNGLVITANTGVVTTGTWQGTAITDTYIADTLTIGAGSTIADDLIVEADLAIANSPSDELCLTYEGTGTTLEWQSCASGSLTTADIDTSAELAAILGDETGTGNVVFSASPTFTGAATFAGATFTSATSTQLAVTSLTSGRVPYVTTGGRLVDSARFTYNGTELNVSNSTTDDTVLVLNASALTTDVAVSIGAPLSTNLTTGRALQITTSGNAFANTMMYTDGSYGMGPGYATRDTFISRLATSSLLISSNRSTGDANLTVTGFITTDSLRPSANDSGALGVSGTAFSDLFLASGGVINFNAGDVTLTHSADTLTVAGGTLVSAANSFTSATSTQLAVTSLTSGRVPYVTTGGRLRDSANFTFDGTNLGFGNTQGIAWGGTRAIFASTTRNNYFFGANAGTSFVNGSNNIAIGTNALLNATSSGDNIAIGRDAGIANTSGSGNLFIGPAFTGYSNTTGGANVYLGYGAGGNNNGDANVFVGNNTMNALTLGSDNTALGAYAGNNLNDTAGSVLIGRFAGFGIAGNYQADNLTIVGMNAGENLQTGADNNTIIGSRSGSALTTGASNILIGYDIELQSNTWSNRLNIGNLIFGTGIDGTGTTLSSGNIGIGTTTPTQKFTVDGGFRLTGAFRDRNNSAGTNGMVLQTTSTGVQWVATSSLGIGGASIAFGTDNQIPFTNSGGTNYDYSANFTFDGTNLVLGTDVGLSRGAANRLDLATGDTLRIVSGAIELGAGDTTITGGTNVLTFAGATTNGYQFQDGPIRPVANDGVALGVSGTAFSDLFLAAGGVVNFDAGDLTLTDTGTNILTLAGGNLAVGANYINNDGGTEGLSFGTLGEVTVTATAATTNAFSVTADSLTTGSAARISSNSANTSARAVLDVINDNAAASGAVALRIQQDSTADIVNFFDGATEVFTILDGGFVGIGDSSPEVLLDVFGSTAGNYLSTIVNNNATGWGQYIFVNNTSASANALEVENSSGSIFRVRNDGRVGIGTTTPQSKLSIGATGVTGSGVAGIDAYYGLNNSTASAVQFGNRTYLRTTNTVATTIVGEILRLEDSTAYANTVRGLEVQTDRGTNTLGENTAISGFGRTFGIRGTTRGDAGALFEPAGGYFETQGAAQGNAIRGYSGSITSASLLALYQDTTTFTGTGLDMNFGNTTGSFTGNFIDAQVAGVTQFIVKADGSTGIDATPVGNAKLTVGGNVVISGNASAGNSQINYESTQVYNGASYQQITNMTVYNGNLYLAMAGGAGAGDLLRWDGSTTTVVYDGAQESLWGMVVYDNKLYFGQGQSNGDSALYYYDGSTTTLAVAGKTNREYAYDMVVFNDRLYYTVLGEGIADEAEVYVLDEGGTSSTLVHDINTNAFSSASIEVFGGVLYVAYSDIDTTEDQEEIHVYSTTDGVTWVPNSVIDSVTDAGPDMRVRDLIVYNSKLLVSVSGDDTGDAKLFDIETAAQGDGPGTSAEASLFESSRNYLGRMAIAEGKLFVGRGTAADDGDLFMYTGGEPVIISSSTQFAAYETVSSVAYYNGEVYAGTGLGAGDADLYRFASTPQATSSYALQFATDSGYGYNATGTIWFEARDILGGVYDDSTGDFNPGTFFVSHSMVTNAGAYDVAEDYPTRDTDLRPGELLMYDTRNEGGMTRADKENANLLAGVVSARPGFLLSQADRTGMVATALVGRVPVTVNGEGGAIEVGDSITVSSEAGIGTKATFGDRAIGYALTSFDPEDEETATSTVTVFVTTHTALGITPDLAQMMADPTASSTASVAEAGTTFWSRLGDLVSNFVDGVLTLAGLKTDLLCVGDVCVTEDEFRAMVNQANVQSVTPPEPEPETPEEPESTEPVGSSEAEGVDTELPDNEPTENTDSSAPSDEQDIFTVEAVPQEGSEQVPAGAESGEVPVSQESLPESEAEPLPELEPEPEPEQTTEPVDSPAAAPAEL